MLADEKFQEFKERVSELLSDIEYGAEKISKQVREQETLKKFLVELKKISIEKEVNIKITRTKPVANGQYKTLSISEADGDEFILVYMDEAKVPVKIEISTITSERNRNFLNFLRAIINDSRAFNIEYSVKH